ncbi:hypothetical protein SAMN05660359_00645 [Geodermatophilus obscurus]|uniref:Uncharacterized protein n=1 Tax=Geodermatophilus obscurus TaxID=1861 RepID=A0A1I5CY72_9ACTN|nr:hypothetical protein [Geodermatophilus obscurus]SFN91950.1 hypothetical protein SAMN05660359_00645 [Geodermatophilus obscurus]
MLDGGPEQGKAGVVPVPDAALHGWLLEPGRGAHRAASEWLAAAFRERLRSSGGPVPLVVRCAECRQSGRRQRRAMLPANEEV